MRICFPREGDLEGFFYCNACGSDIVIGYPQVGKAVVCGWCNTKYIVVPYEKIPKYTGERIVVEPEDVDTLALIEKEVYDKRTIIEDSE